MWNTERMMLRFEQNSEHQVAFENRRLPFLGAHVLSTTPTEAVCLALSAFVRIISNIFEIKSEFY